MATSLMGPNVFYVFSVVAVGPLDYRSCRPPYPQATHGLRSVTPGCLRLPLNPENEFQIISKRLSTLIYINKTNHTGILIKKNASVG